MSRPRHRTLAVVTGLALATASLGAPPSAAAKDLLEVVSDATVGVVDLLVLRPVGLVSLGLGATFALPVSSLFNFVGLPIGQDTTVFVEDFDRYVVQPAEYTFGRPLGRDVAGS